MILMLDWYENIGKPGQSGCVLFSESAVLAFNPICFVFRANLYAQTT